MSDRTPFEIDVEAAIDRAFDTLFADIERAAKRRGIVKPPELGDEDLEPEVDSKQITALLHRMAGFDVADAYEEWVREGAD